MAWRLPGWYVWWLWKKESGKRPRLKDERIVSYVRKKLALDWSPEIIANKIALDLQGASISHEAVYQYIYNPKTQGREELIASLVRSHRKRKKKGIGRSERNTKIPNRISINERPVSADNRSRYGHWEGDSLVSGKSLAALNSLVERKCRLTYLTKLDRKTAEQTRDAVIERLGPLPEKARQSLTVDNGTENAGHEEITDAIGIRCYFADPYASWQRGSNEQVNGVVRRYFPKGTDFSKVTNEQVGTTRTELHGWNHVLTTGPGNVWATKLQQKSLLLHLLIECGVPFRQEPLKNQARFSNKTVRSRDETSAHPWRVTDHFYLGLGCPE